MNVKRLYQVSWGVDGGKVRVVNGLDVVSYIMEGKGEMGVVMAG